MSRFEAPWVDDVCRHCDPVFDAADVGFVRQALVDGQGRPSALLWEAAPSLFLARYPDSEIDRSYGDQWPDTPCLDYWAYLDLDERRCRIAVEGWRYPEFVVPLRGNGDVDGGAVAAVFAGILRVVVAPRREPYR
ncbi:hypothetical protein E8D34_16990 [Nocardioides sp. GY 10113]|uniref:hypothetical protein n=1 Tax=Nocardioides sp. GY 10113 TaxID=2569761 RepID=UPI0010A79BFE|nr:hypothetical protein [Nocardioides sp. GY 10113]TIC82181.1 hypothetical protein E8D34_16990 [Nocardioides sp. GY 10113]